MRNVMYDLEVTHFHQLSSRLLVEQEAQALRRGLQFEKKVARIPEGRFTQLFFCPQTPGGPLLRSFCAQSRGDEVRLSLERPTRAGHRRDTVRVPRQALRLALRGSTAQELFPEFPEGPEPVLAVSSSRFRYVHTSGWQLTLDEELAFHPVSVSAAWSEQALRPPVPAIAQERGSALELAVHASAQVPDWLRDVVERLPSYSLFQAGLSRLMAHGAQELVRAEPPISIEVQL
jgi:hypothetical protein